MSISGIGTFGYPAAGFYQTRRETKSAARAGSAGQIHETLQRSEMSGGAFELHISNDEDGEVVGAMCGRDHSITVYKPKDFDPANPVYKAKVWDKDGNVTERMVDVSEVDPRDSDYIDMFAYTSYLSASGDCPSAETSFWQSSANQHGSTDRSYEDLFCRTDWVGALADAMQTQYQAGNIEGYLEYKPFWDFLTH